MSRENQDHSDNRAVTAGSAKMLRQENKVSVVLARRNSMSPRISGRIAAVSSALKARNLKLTPNAHRSRFDNLLHAL
jgi:hypothetical protein